VKLPDPAPPGPDAGLLAAVAEAVQARSPIDWTAVESSSDNPVTRESIRQLKTIAEIADLHSRIRQPDVRSDQLADLLSQRESVSHDQDSLERWGPLRLLEKIGAGSFGDVFRAYEPRLDREVALKLLRQDDLHADITASAVIHEGRLLARVRHPNVVTIYGADRINGQVGIWMEFVRGETLAQALWDGGPFTADRVVAIGIDLCRALTAVHGAGLVHRDIKTQNVMCEADGRIVLMDFGAVAELTFDDASTGLAGSPLYLSPELFDGVEASPQSDIYSVGVLLYHLVTSEFPVRGRTIKDLRVAHRENKRIRLRDIRPDLPAQLIDAIETALSAAPDQRFATAEAMEATLRASLVVEDAEAATDTARRAHRPSSTVKRLVVACSAVIVAGVVVSFSLSSTTARARLWLYRAASLNPPAGTAVGSAAMLDATTSLRKLPFPAYMYLGGPSRDGHHISYTDLAGDLALLNPSSLSTRVLTHHSGFEHAEASIPSDDGQQVAYTWWAADGFYELRVIATDGTTPQTVLRGPDIEIPQPAGWSHDGKYLLISVQHKDGAYSLNLLRIADRVVVPLKNFGRRPPLSVSMSPDARFVVYDRVETQHRNKHDLFILSLEDLTETALIQSPADDLFALWTADGQHIVFVSDRTGTPDLWVIPVDDGTARSNPTLVSRNLGRVQPLGVTRDGSYYYSVLRGAVDVYLASIDFSSGNRPIDAEPQPVSPASVGTNRTVAWSASGRELAYVSMGGLSDPNSRESSLMIRNMQNGSTRELRPELVWFVGPVWSPGGETILVKGRDSRQRWGLHAVDVATAHVTPVVLADRPKDESDIGAYTWSADGGAVLYSRAGGGIVRHDVSTGQEIQLLDTNGLGLHGIHPARGFGLSPDGRLVGFSAFAPHGTSFDTVVDVTTIGGVPRELVRASHPDDVMFKAWAPDGHAIIVSRSNIAKSPTFTLWSVPISGDPPQRLGLSVDGLGDVAVDPTGKRIAFTAGMPLTEVWVLNNFLPGQHLSPQP
jgi:serine/threonine protein kinase/Tol biopolymer transport system component